MHPIESFVRNPVKVAVGVILLVLFGVISIFRMPMQLTPEVERPTISVETRWPGASPQEIEREIVQPQEEQLQSVEGVTKMSSQSTDSAGTVVMEFAVGTDMDEAVLKVNSRLQQVREYPIDADKPVITTSNSSNSPIAWFILSVKPASREELLAAQEKFPQHRDAIDAVLESPNEGLALVRLRKLTSQYPELAELAPPDIDVTRLRKFASDQIESRFERVSGVANSNVLGGRDPELQVLVDPTRLAARGLTLTNVRDRLRAQNVDTSGGDLWEGKRRYTVRVLGRFTNLQEVEEVVLAIPDGQPVLLKDVAEVRLDHKKPDGFVRRFGMSNISLNVQRETGANVLDVMEGLQEVVADLNANLLPARGLMLTQVYDETEYIRSSIQLVNQNIILGSALTVIVLLMFLHLNARTVIVVPLLAGSAVAALFVSPWFFVVTLLLIIGVGTWFARGALVVAMAIPISIVGTFLMLNGLGRSLNVISLAGLAFAVGMLVDNAVVVLENIYRYYQLGYSPWNAAVRGAKEVWGAVLASTLTTLFVFVPIVFLQGEAGQLFADIALAISAAVGLSLIVSVIVVPMAASRILGQRGESTDDAAASAEARAETARQREEAVNPVERFARRFASLFAGAIIGFNRFVQGSMWRQFAVSGTLIAAAFAGTYWLMPSVEYLPNGNRNLVICLVFPPPGYNLEHMKSMGEVVEAELQPYWDIEPGVDEVDGKPAIADFSMSREAQFVCWTPQRDRCGLVNWWISFVPSSRGSSPEHSWSRTKRVSSSEVSTVVERSISRSRGTTLKAWSV
ncbi:MAG: efflux RND transporter permease subunit [Pirellulaceae bacterium]